jgi:hypothetical protein
MEKQAQRIIESASTQYNDLLNIQNNLENQLLKKFAKTVEEKLSKEAGKEVKVDIEDYLYDKGNPTETSEMLKNLRITIYGTTIETINDIYNINFRKDKLWYGKEILGSAANKNFYKKERKDLIIEENKKETKEVVSL